jgi:hypothetical protein
LVDYDRAVGRTLRKNNVEIDKQLQVIEATEGAHSGRSAGAQAR